MLYFSNIYETCHVDGDIFVRVVNLKGWLFRNILRYSMADIMYWVIRNECEEVRILELKSAYVGTDFCHGY